MTLSARGGLGAVVLVPALAALAACGGSSSGFASGAAATTTQSTMVSAPSKASAALTTKAPSPPTYRQLTSDKIVNALLTLDDVPAGYTADKPDRTDSNVTFCHYKQPNKENGYAAITFEKSTGLIGHTIRQYDSVADASAQQEALAKAVDAGCSMTDEGKKLKVARMSAPKLGDRSVGVTLSGQGAVIDEVFVQVGPVVLAVADAGVGDADVAQMTSVAKKAIAKYKKVAAAD